MEYDEAARLGIDVLPFLLDEGADWPAEFDERTTDVCINAWRSALRPRSGHEKYHFKTKPGTLDVLPAVARWLETRTKRERLKDYLSCIRLTHGNINFLGLPLMKETPDVRIDHLFVEPAITSDYVDADRIPIDGPF